MPLPSNSTIASIVSQLAAPEAYIRGALSNVSFAKGQPEKAVYRIGVGGSGGWPNYRTERTGMPHCCFSGRTHRPAFEDDNLLDENWSEACMTATELIALLALVSPRSVKAH